MAVHAEKLKAGFKTAHALLGSHPEDAQIASALDAVLQAGRQETRVYHRAEHFEEVAGTSSPQTPMEAISFRAGLYHDVVYQHVDAYGEHRSGFAPDIANTLGLLASRAMDDSIHILPTKDPLHQAILKVFGVQPGEALNPKHGQNELLSAFFSAEEGRGMGVADKYLLAEAAHIEGTIPFGPANHFEGLRDRLRAANELLPEGGRLTADEINETIHSAVAMANRDVGGFKAPEFASFIENTRELLVEEAPGSSDQFDDPSVLWVPLTKQSRFFTDVVAPKSLTGEMRVYHSIDNVPPADELGQMESAALDNVYGLGDYLNANAVSLALASALEVQQGRSVPSSQAALFDTQDFNLRGAHKADDVHTGALAACENDVMLTDRFAAQLLSGLGSSAVKNLRERAEASGMFNPEAAPIERERGAFNFLRDAEQTLGALGFSVEQKAAQKKEPEAVKDKNQWNDILDTLRQGLTPDLVSTLEKAGQPPKVNISRGR